MLFTACICVAKGGGGLHIERESHAMHRSLLSRFQGLSANRSLALGIETSMLITFPKSAKREKGSAVSVHTQSAQSGAH